MRVPLPLQGQAPPRRHSGPAVAEKGFRPFFLLASIFVAIAMPAWTLVLRGALVPSSYLDPVLWHAHEMVFGFAAAVIAGFLLTATSNWTGRETLTGVPLLALAALWIFGRVAMTGALGHAAPIDLAFLPCLAIAIARPIVVTKNARNAVMVVVLLVLTAANATFHLDPARFGRRALYASVDVVVLLVALIASRVVPMFTKNATGYEARSRPLLDKLGALALAALAVLDAAWPDRQATGAIAAVAAVLLTVRSARWGARPAMRVPLLAILHVAHAWIPIGLALRALASFTDAVPIAAATHALTAGAIGGATLAMMARVALGHTGRPLVPPRSVVLAFALVTLAALLRVLGPILAPQAYASTMLASGLLFAAAFAIYAIAYTRILVTARADTARAAPTAGAPSSRSARA